MPEAELIFESKSDHVLAEERLTRPLRRSRRLNTSSTLCARLLDELQLLVESACWGDQGRTREQP
jgi:hypothetical protein